MRRSGDKGPDPSDDWRLPQSPFTPVEEQADKTTERVLAPRSTSTQVVESASLPVLPGLDATRVEARGELPTVGAR